jgi:PAS domain S-box
MASIDLKESQIEDVQTQGSLNTEPESPLHDHNLLLATLLGYLRSGVYFKDLQSRFVLINPAQAGTLKLGSPEEAIGKSDRDFFAEEHAKDAFHDEQEIIRTGRPLLEKEEKETWPDGRVSWVSTSKMPIKSRDGRIVGTFGISRDVTEKHRMREALLETETLLQELVTAIGDIFWIRDFATGRTVYVSSSFERIWGRPIEVLYTNAVDLAQDIHADDRQKVLELLEKKSSEPFEVSYRICRPDGEMRWIRYRSFPIFDAEKRVVRVAGVSSDFTESKRVTDEFAKTQSLLASIVNSSHDAIFSETPDGKIASWNPAAETIFGYSRVEAIGQPSDMLLGPDHENDRLWTIKHLSSGKAIEYFDTVRRHKDGRLVPVTLTSFAVRDETGATLGISTTARDRSARAKLEQKLSTVEAQLRFVLEATNVLVLTVDHDWVLTYANREAFGAAVDGVLGKKLWECQPALLGSPFEKSYRAVMDEKVAQRCEGGLTVTNKWYESTAYPIPTGILILVYDVTEKHATEDQLRRSQKLEAIGQLAAGVAHEINTPIQYVGDNTQFFKESWVELIRLFEMAQEACKKMIDGKCDPTAIAEFDAAVRKADLPYLCQEVPAAIDQTLDGVKRVANIVRAMKEFSHPGSEEMQAVDLNKAIDATVTIARNEWKYVADVSLQLDPDLPVVVCLGGEINQVLLNLLVNAAHAIKSAQPHNSTKKGRIDITTRLDGTWAEIKIQDTGTGIPENIRDKVFDPFFTTKDVGKGTGQGLSLAQAVVVKKHSGKIWFETELGKGTAFFVRIPLAGKATS